MWPCVVAKLSTRTATDAATRGGGLRRNRRLQEMISRGLDIDSWLAGRDMVGISFARTVPTQRSWAGSQRMVMCETVGGELMLVQV